MILKELAKFIKENLANKGTVIRWGGEEFLIIFPNKSYHEITDTINIEIKEKINSIPFIFEGEKIFISISGGVIDLAKYEYKINQSLYRVDQLLYEGKRIGRNVILYDDKTA